MAAHARTELSPLPTIADPVHALCYHVLGIMACHAGTADWREHGVATSRALARIVVATKSTDVFVRVLADLRDDVTDRPLITPIVDSRNHGVVPFAENLVVAWLDDVAAGDETFARVRRAAVGVRIPGNLAMTSTVSMADVLAYGGVLDGVLEADARGSMPVCVDARVVGLLKKLAVMRVLTQYHAVYAGEVAAIDEFVDAFADDPECSMTVCWDVVADNTSDAVLWTCLKMDFMSLASACELVQADEQTWRAEVIDRTYAETGITRWKPGDAQERAANMYLAGELHELIARTYGDQRLSNPTHSQASTYLRLMMVRMREARSAHVCDAPEIAWPQGWADIRDVPPYCMEDVIARADGRGVVLQNATRSASYGLVAPGGGDALFLDAQGGEATLVRAFGDSRFDFDGMLMGKRKGARWRATIVISPATSAHKAAEAHMVHVQALLEHAGKKWVE